MTDPDEVQNNWGVLALSGTPIETPEHDEIKAIGTDIEILGQKVYHALDKEKRPHLLVPINPSEPFKNDTKSAGIHIIKRIFSLTNTPFSFIDVVCMNLHLKIKFAYIVSEILAELTHNQTDTGNTCRRIINEWRELLEPSKKRLLNIKRLSGLYGELWYLRELLKVDISSFDYWTGPDANRHDFTNQHYAIEIKTTLKANEKVFTINGIDQLKIPPFEKLFVVTFILELSDTGESLPDIIESIRLLNINYKKFLKLLQQVGYFIAQDANYINKKFLMKEFCLYNVDDSFPKIINQSFINGHLPPNILNIQYKINLQTTPPNPLNEEDSKALKEKFAHNHV